MRRRNGHFNPKRQLANLDEWDGERLDLLARKVRYGGNPEHKRNPGNFALTPSSGPRPGKSLCDEVEVYARKEALKLLHQGCRKGLVSKRLENGWPKNIWSVKDGRALEAQLESPETGVYHGYPLQEQDPFCDKVLERWERNDTV